jgi:hypothetical protein
MFRVNKEEQGAMFGTESLSTNSSSAAEDDAPRYRAAESQSEEESSEEERTYVSDGSDNDEDTISEHVKKGNEGASKAEPFQSPNSSLDPRDRYDTTFSHSFASDATEERAHVSSPRESVKSPEKNHVSVTKSKKTDGEVYISPPSLENHSAGGSVGAGPVKSPTNSHLEAISMQSMGSTSTTSRTRRMMAKRVPGGAAAKLIGRRNEDDYKVNDDGDDSLEVLAPEEELIRSRDLAKAEFAVGSTENRRYRTKESESDNVVNATTSGEVSIPILDRNEVFHENAAKAIESLLNNGETTKTLLKPQKSSPFQPPPKTDDLPNVLSNKSEASGGVAEAPGTFPMTGKNPLVQHFLTKKLERRLEVIKSRMKDPNKNLTELMSAIVSPSDDDFNRHYMVRRKNACGALQVLTTNTSHRVNICWTVGVLPSLTSVLEDSGSETLEDAISDFATRREYIEARKRAVSALMNLAIPLDNKLPMFHCPRLVASLIQVIKQDDGEARRGCCAILAHLSNHKDNRLLMAQVPGLVDAVTAVIDPRETNMGSKDSVDQISSSEASGDSTAFDKFVSENDSENESENENRNDSKGQVKAKKTQSEDPAEASARYDEDPNEFLHGARQNVFALFGQLVKDKDNSFILARHAYLMEVLVTITKLQESSSQEFGLKLLAHFSRHRANSKLMVFKIKTVVPAIIYATQSENKESRKYACYALQNLSQDKPCRQELASTENLLPSVCRRIRNAKDEEEKLAALYTLKNLTDEPANLIPMTNTPECFATLMQIAHASDDSVTEMMQYIGCDALATLSHWFRSIATSGQRIGTIKQNEERSKDELFVPTLRVVTWEAWQ